MSKNTQQVNDLKEISTTSTPADSNENQFPIDVFPKLFEDLANDLKQSLNFPIDYTGTAILTAISTIIGTTVKLKVKSGWFEYPSIYSCIIGNAGANKTHPINYIFSPIKDIDLLNQIDFETRYNEYEQYKKLPKEEREKMPIMIIPKNLKSVIINFTPEALYKLLGDNLRGCTILSDEMMTFFGGMNNYSSSDQTSVYLSFWSNQSTTIDRKNTPFSLNINKPYLSIIGGLQPRMLSYAFPIQKLNNGFFQRFLFAFPDSSIKHPLSEIESDNSIFEKYSEFIKKYLNDTKISENEIEVNSKILSWTREAFFIFKNWQEKNCDIVNENQNNVKGEIASKYDNHFLRLAILLQIMEDPKSTEINYKSALGAKKLCTYYMNCAFKVLEIIQDPSEYLKTLSENKRTFYHKIKYSFTTSEAIAIGLNHDIQERRMKEFLNDSVLFKRIRHGFYEKTIKTKS